MELYVNALLKKFHADRAIAVANLNTYLTNAVGVGEHPDVVTEMEKLVAAVADADGKIATLTQLIDTSKNPDDPKTK
mgnify:FL=1